MKYLSQLLMVASTLLFASCSEFSSNLNTSEKTQITYKSFCDQNQIKCEKKNPSELYPSKEEFESILKIVTAMGEHGSNGISFHRNDLADSNLSRAMTILGLNEDFKKMKDFFALLSLKEVILEGGSIMMHLDSESNLQNTSGLVIKRSTKIEISINDQALKIDGLALGTSAMEADQVEKVVYEGEGDITLHLRNLIITGVPLQMMIIELFPFLDFTRNPSLNQFLNAAPSLKDWYFKAERVTTLEKDFFEVLYEELPKIFSHSLLSELNKTISSIEKVEISDSSPYVTTFYDNSVDLECEFKAGATPRSILKFVDEYKIFDLTLESKSRVRLETSGIPAEAIILGSKFKINTSRLVINENGIELRKIPIIRKIQMNWDDLTPPELKFKCP